MTLQGQATLTRAGPDSPYGLATGYGGCSVPSGLRPVATFGQQSNGTDTSQTARWFIPLTDPNATTVLPVFGHWWETATADIDSGASITIAAAVEMSDGTVVPFTFNGGQHTATLASTGGALAIPDHPLWIGSQVSATDSTGATFSCTGFWLRVYVSVASGVKWNLNFVKNSGADAFTTGTGADLTLAGSGSVSGGSYSYGYGPVAVLTRAHPGRRVPVVASVTDSIFHGASDQVPSYGPVVRACAALRYPLVKLSRIGDYAQGAASISGWKYRGVLLDGCTHAIVELGTNDQQLSSASGVTTLQARLTTIGNALVAMGIKPYIATVPPRTTSTDSWATAANQTPVAGSAITYIATVNQWIRAMPSPYLGVVDLAGLVSSATDSGLWAANATADGVHPAASLMTGSIATAVRNLMSTWTV